MATWWAVLVGSVLLLPVLLFTGLPSPEAWPFICISVLAEIGYYITLSAAYRTEDFSLVYPIARGVAPALIALWSVLFSGNVSHLGHYLLGF